MKPIPQEHDEGSPSIQSLHSDHLAGPTGTVDGVTVAGAEVVVLMASLLIVCFFSVFLVHPCHGASFLSVKWDRDAFHALGFLWTTVGHNF